MFLHHPHCSLPSSFLRHLVFYDILHCTGQYSYVVLIRNGQISFISSVQWEINAKFFAKIQYLLRYKTDSRFISIVHFVRYRPKLFYNVVSKLWRYRINIMLKALITPPFSGNRTVYSTALNAAVTNYIPCCQIVYISAVLDY